MLALTGWSGLENLDWPILSHVGLWIRLTRTRDDGVMGCRRERRSPAQALLMNAATNGRDSLAKFSLPFELPVDSQKSNRIALHPMPCPGIRHGCPSSWNAPERQLSGQLSRNKARREHMGESWYDTKPSESGSLVTLSPPLPNSVLPTRPW